MRTTEVPELVGFRYAPGDMPAVSDGILYRCVLYGPHGGSYADLAKRVLDDVGWEKGSPSERVEQAKRFARGFYAVLDAKVLGAAHAGEGAFLGFVERGPQLTPAVSIPAPTGRALPSGGVRLDHWVQYVRNGVALMLIDRHERLTFESDGRMTTMETVPP